LCDHFYKNARKTLAFSGCFIRFSLDLMLWVVAGATRQYFMCEKPRACLCERVFCVPLKIYHGLSFFFLENAKHSYISSSFFLERRKKNERRKNSLKSR
jgi:hypothetical protein